MNENPISKNSLIPGNLFPYLSIGKYCFTLSPKEKISLPDYTGSTWRGLIGNALHDLFCPLDRPECETCSVKDSCAYYCLYEAGSEEKAFANLPRPYIFSFLEEKQGKLQVEVTLTGYAGDFIPHLIAAWSRAGEMGAGKGRGRFDLIEVKQVLPKGGDKTVYHHKKGPAYDKTTYPFTDYLKADMPKPPWSVIIQNPLRIRKNGKNLKSLDLSAAFNSLAIRLSSLNRNYCKGERVEKDKWDKLKVFFTTPGNSSNRIKWFDWKRFSSTQNNHIMMGGFVGTCTITPPDNEMIWWQWWQTASLFHMGKGASMGMGKIVI